jgi:predicted nuclease with RNAse H fold
LFFGIDLTSKEAKLSACVCINEKLEVTYSEKLRADNDILSAITVYSPKVIAIDSPLSLPSGLCCLEQDCDCQANSPLKGRECERQLAKLGIPCYFTTKRSIINKMVERGIKIKQQFEQQGHRVIEVYPYASKVCLFGQPIPKKTTSEGSAWLREKMSSLFGDTDFKSGRWNHDSCDAAIAAYTAYLFVQKSAKSVGDEKEGLIYIPKSNYDRKENG